MPNTAAETDREPGELTAGLWPPEDGAKATSAQKFIPLAFTAGKRAAAIVYPVASGNVAGQRLERPVRHTTGVEEAGADPEVTASCRE